MDQPLWDLRGHGADVTRLLSLVEDRVGPAGAQLLVDLRRKDAPTFEHACRSAAFAAELVVDLRLTHEESVLAVRAALFHDVGKITIPDEILLHPGTLAPDDWAVMQSHAGQGELLLAPHDEVADLAPVVGAHHESWDGGGYDDGLAGTEIPLAARVVSVADSVDAMRSSRRYRDGNLTTADVIEVLQDRSGVQWDPDLVPVAVSRLQAAG
ncbi:MAG: HD-GYP domain-containing protein [Actinomycetes bacterium]